MAHKKSTGPHGNGGTPTPDISASARVSGTVAICGARTRSGEKCRQLGMVPSGRCRFHGGLSTGPRTPEGRERCRRARWKHGGRSKAAIEAERALNAYLRVLRTQVTQVIAQLGGRRGGRARARRPRKGAASMANPSTWGTIVA
jgi:hypothetical protein